MIRTVRCSGHLGGGLSAQVHAGIHRGGVSVRGVSAQGAGGVCPGECLPGGDVCSNACWDTHPPVNRVTDRQV